MATLAFLALIAVMHHTGIIYNGSDSIPTGFYRRIDRPAKKGDWIALRKPDTEYMRQWREIRGLIKKLVAVDGDNVRIDDRGITVNGVLLDKTKPIDFPGIQPANTEKTLETDEMIVASDYNALSYDSRYFGILKTSDITNVLEPIYTWGTPDETID